MITLHLPPTNPPQEKGRKITLIHPVFIGEHGNLLLAMTTPVSAQETLAEMVQIASNDSKNFSLSVDTRLVYKNDRKAPGVLHRVSALLPPQSGSLT